MTGKDHIIANISSGVILASGIVYLQKFTFDIFNFKNINIGQSIIDFLSDTSGLPLILYIIFSFAMYIFGTLLPDIDSEKSMLGKVMHLHVEHRTWTHTIYLPIVLFIISIWCRMFFFLGFGILMHLFWDSLSKGGVCYFYPFSQYRYFGTTGAKIKNGHKAYLYKTGKQSETVVITVLVTVAVFATVFLIFSLFSY